MVKIFDHVLIHNMLQILEIDDHAGFGVHRPFDRDLKDEIMAVRPVALSEKRLVVVVGHGPVEQPVRGAEREAFGDAHSVKYNLLNRLFAFLAPAAVRAMAPHPHPVEIVHKHADFSGVARDIAGLEIAVAVRLGAQARARKVGAARVGQRAVDDDDFSVHARAGLKLDRAGHEIVEPVEGLFKGTRRFAAVKNADGDVIPGHFREVGQERMGLFAVDDMEVLEIRRGDPDEFPRGKQARFHDLKVMVPVEDYRHDFLEKYILSQ